jgi:hypothetical protein
MVTSVLSQITEGHISLDPSWFFGGITIIAVFLFWNQVKDIKGSLKSMSESMKDISALVHLHDKDIAVIKRELKIKE